MPTLNSKALYSLLLSSLCAFNSSALAADEFPEVILLPDGWGPEGIATGRGTEFFAGARQMSPVAGAVYKGDLRTGEGGVLVPAQPNRFALGLKLDRRTAQLFVAGGPSGAGFIYDGDTGEDIEIFQFAVAPTFINDVIVTRSAAFFTDSLNPVLYVVPLGPGGGVPEPATFRVLPITGDFEMEAGFNLNGIAATPNGKVLIVVQSNTGLLFRVDRRTGVALNINLGGASVSNGDGILLDGRTLYVVRNQLNRIAVVDLNQSYTAGVYVSDILSPEFGIPTTIAEFGASLYAVNARFGTP